MPYFDSTDTGDDIGRYDWMENILNFPYRFTKPNFRIKDGFYVCRIIRVESPLPNLRFEIFIGITYYK